METLSTSVMIMMGNVGATCWAVAIAYIMQYRYALQQNKQHLASFFFGVGSAMLVFGSVIIGIMIGGIVHWNI